VAEALPKLKCVAVRADRPTTREIKDLLGRLEAAAQSRIGGLQTAPVRLDDMTVVVLVIKHLRKRELSGRK
jgi:hypothetical protein